MISLKIIWIGSSITVQTTHAFPWTEDSFKNFTSSYYSILLFDFLTVILVLIISLNFSHKKLIMQSMFLKTFNDQVLINVFTLKI